MRTYPIELIIPAKLSVWLPTSLSEGDIFAFTEGANRTYVSLHDGRSSGVYVSDPDGVEWTLIPGLPNSCCVVSLAASNAGVYAGSVEHGVLYSDGRRWKSVGDGTLSTSEVVSLLVHRSTVFAGTRTEGVFRLEGNQWFPFNDGLPSGRPSVISLAATEDALLVSETSNLYRRDPQDGAWTGLNPCLPSGRIPHGLRPAIDQVIFGWGAHGVYRSDDGGITWASLADSFWERRFVRSLVVVGATVFACTQGEAASDIFRSLDGGATWMSFGEGLPRPVWTQALGSLGNVLLAGAGNHGVWRREVLLDDHSGSPDPLFSLHQNEPNPFYERTRIRFTLHAASEGRLDLLDLRGEVLRTLWKDAAGAGDYEIFLEDSTIGPGIYTYRFSARGISQSRRLVLLR